MTTPTEKTCLFCQKKPMDTYPMGEKNGYLFIACKTCGSVVTEPWVTRETLDKFYGDIQPEVVHVPYPRSEVQRAMKLFKKLMPNGGARRFLDVQCRQGYTAVAAKALGFKAHGIDPHPFFTAFAKDKFDPTLFENVTLQDYAARGEQADLICVDEAFCEQPDPESYAAALAKVLAAGGKIYLREPDGNHLRLPGRFTAWRFPDPPINFSYPSKKGMETILQRHGLKIEKRFLTWKPFMRMIITHK